MTLFGVAIVIGLLGGWLCGGHFVHLGSWPFRLGWLVPVALGAEFYIALGIGRTVPPWVLPLHLGAYALLIVVVLVNRQLPGMPVLALGLALNALVIGLNGGLMPEDPQTLHVKHRGEELSVGQHPPQTKDVVLPHDQARLWWLGDVLDSPPGFPVQTVVSPGDVIIAVGLAWVVAGLMRAPPVTHPPTMVLPAD